MLINGFGKFVQKAGLSEVEKLTGTGTAGGRKSDKLQQTQKSPAAGMKRKSRSRTKKG
jgi:hypothetical protein